MVGSGSRLLVAALALVGLFPAAVFAACPVAPVGSTSDTVVILKHLSNSGAIGPVSLLDATREGGLVYDSATKSLKYCDGTDWVELSTGGGGSPDVAKGLFTKEDPETVAFTKTGNGTATVKAGTVVEVNNTLVNFVGATAITMPALTAGTDYAIYACGNATAVADSNLSTTASCTGGFRKIGGFHYAPGGNAAAQSGGNTTAQINEYSFWDIKWRPQCKNPTGMTLVADSFWADIYLTGVDHHTNGTSKYNVTIADGSSPPKIPTAFGGNGSTAYGSFNWYEASEVMQSHGKDLLSQQEFMMAAYGTTEQTNGGTDPVSTILRAAYTSKWGVMLATGNMWVWGRDSSYRYDNGTWAWTTTAGSRGQSYIQGGYGTVRALLGGAWNYGAGSGSRASVWNHYPWYSNNGVGARGRCDHLRLD